MTFADQPSRLVAIGCWDLVPRLVCCEPRRHKQPDFDHVATLSGVPPWLPRSLLEAGVPTNFPSIPAVPGGSACREAVHLSNPIANGTHHVQSSGLDLTRPLDVNGTVFFATWPFNRTDPAGDDP